MIDFAQIDYLKNGSRVQIRALGVLARSKILEKLAGFTPVLIGTIPIDIAIASSDLDIACCWADKKEFIQRLRAFEDSEDFSIEEQTISGRETIISNFKTDGSEIEIFGQNVPVSQQDGYRHMVIEYQILQQKDDDFREQVIRLKELGHKTEPAFA